MGLWAHMGVREWFNGDKRQKLAFSYNSWLEVTKPSSPPLPLAPMTYPCFSHHPQLLQLQSLPCPSWWCFFTGCSTHELSFNLILSPYAILLFRRSDEIAEELSLLLVQPPSKEGESTIYYLFNWLCWFWMPVFCFTIFTSAHKL